MSVVELLAQVPLFGGLDAAARHRLSTRLRERRLLEGEFLFHEGEPGDALYVVAEGELEVVVVRGGRELTLARLGPRSHLGEMAVLDDAPRSSSVRAAGPTLLLEISRATFMEELEASPPAMRALLSEMASRLRVTNAMVGDSLARDAVREVEGRRTFGERMADRFASYNGSWYSIVGVLVATAGWVAWNAVRDRPFDPFPYVLFNLVLGIAVALQGPLLMMSQNRQAVRDRAQAAADFQLNLKNELALQGLVRDLAHADQKLEELLARGAATGAAPVPPDGEAPGRTAPTLDGHLAGPH